ncbi:UDP-glucose 4-epimerase family protein [Shewanella salipaludis]|uniref:SDR family oxidoreductase n=1 Tax=Shewanella salipaludis TaxID=2723052 RepID=A0A972JKX6_9GAMM|nr:SDR family oxidoreductase [Shewanella salipaludis]NMH65604.1 SDR family oxidoreductase [Shewanella salipaludis]
MKVALTGYSGFVGKYVLRSLEDSYMNITLLGRSGVSSVRERVDFDLSEPTDITEGLRDIDVVVHCAAMVHQMQKADNNTAFNYHRINMMGTLELAKQAAKAGVKRFIFISTIKVNGECTTLSSPFTAFDEPTPKDNYGDSKAKAEKQLFELAENNGIEVVVIRPTLVYGPGVKANFASLLNFVYMRLPLPFGCITDNKRSLVSVVNLVDLIKVCIVHPKAANQVFLVSDDNDISTSDMVVEMGKSLGRKTWLLPVPLWCFKLVGRVINKSDVVERLIGSLQVDISHTKETLGWKPPQSLEEGFKNTAQKFFQSKNKNGRL